MTTEDVLKAVGRYTRESNECERRSAQGRWTKKGKRTSDKIQITVRVNPKTAGKLGNMMVRA
jgi:hypothetical protein